MHPNRVRRASGFTIVTALIAAMATILAPTAFGANQLAINATLPAAFKILGKVTNSAGTAVPGVQVQASGPDFAFATTNATGNYVLQGLNPGSYSVAVTPPSTTGYQRGYYTTANANHFSATTPTNVVLGPNKTLLTIKLVIGFGIRGKVTNLAGVPLANASLVAFGPGFAFATTNSTGDYTLRGLPAGSYQVSVSPPSNTNYLGGYYTTANTSHVTPNYASATAVTLGPTKTLLVMKLGTGYSIGGKVTNAAGTALAGVSVSAFGSAGSGSAVTNSSGIYLIRALRPGSYKVGVEPAYNQHYQSGYYTTANAAHVTPSIASGTTVVVGPNKTLLQMKLAVAFAISGKVTNAAGVAIPNAAVSASSSNDSSSAITNSTGNYVIRGLDPGTYRVSVDAPFNSNYQSGYYTTANAAHFTRSEASATNVVVGPNKTLLLVKLPTGYKIGGTISGAGVGVLANAYITASGPNGSGWAVTNSLGKYLIQGLPAGSYKVQLTAPFSANFQDGWYSSATATHFVASFSSATNVTIGP